MGEVVTFPGSHHMNSQQDGGDIGAHFESEIEAQAQHQEIVQSVNFFRRQFPSFFMNPAEMVGFLEKTRGRVEEIEKQAA